jgi:hypothetical protein
MRPIILTLFLIIILGCAKKEPDLSIPFIDQAIFKNARYIEVPLYSYTLNGKTYTFHGTSNDTISASDDNSIVHVIPYNFYDTLSNQPRFAWAKTGSKNVMVGIFNERISIDNEKQQIKNISAIVWAWNTGMSTGQEGAISFEDGCNVINGIIQYNKSPKPLTNGGRYILAIWAWDEYAERVAFSSREIPFIIEK